MRNLYYIKHQTELDQVSKMSDVPPPVGSYDFEIQQSNSSEDELRTESALRKFLHTCEAHLNQLMMMIGKVHCSLGAIMEDIRITIQLKEQIELEMKKFLPNAQRVGENDMHTSQPRRLSLQFWNGLSLPILTGWEIKGNESTSIEVALIDDLSGQVVESGPEANANVEIVVLKGNLGESDNWTSEEFNSSIVAERRGTKSLLAGNVDVKLIKGVGVVGNIKFRHSKKHMKKDEFKLGARVKQSFSGTNIREAKTETFTVSDKRNEYNKKHDIPSLNDEVWRLKNIAKNRKIHKQLREQNIHTVRDFLVLHFKDPERLKNIVGLESKKCEVTVENALKCKIDKRVTCYIDSSRNKAVVFSLVDQVLGVFSGGQYTLVDELSENDKEDARKLAVDALENRKDGPSFDDEASLLDYLSAAINHAIPQGLKHPRGQNVDGSEMIVKCGHTWSNARFKDMITSSINIADGSTTHSRSLSIGDYEILQCQPSVEHDTSSAFDYEILQYQETMLADFDEFDNRSVVHVFQPWSNASFEDIPSSINIAGGSTTHSRSLSISDYEILQCQPSVEQNTSSAFDLETRFAGFDEFPRRKSLTWKRWVVLINVLSLRWESMRKNKVTSQKLPVRKRQRIS